jgi:hypothetical protein
MQKFKSIILAVSLSVVAFGCGNKGFAALEKLGDEACACKDKACAEAVNKKLDEAMKEAAKGGEPSADDAKKLMATMEKAGKCLAEKMSGN